MLSLLLFHIINQLPIKKKKKKGIWSLGVTCRDLDGIETLTLQFANKNSPPAKPHFGSTTGEEIFSTNQYTAIQFFLLVQLIWEQNKKWNSVAERTDKLYKLSKK